MPPRWERKVWDACSTGGRRTRVNVRTSSNPEPEARSCIRCMWPLREECFSSLFTLKAVYFYSILWAALQDSIMFSSLTRILTQINKFSVFVTCIRHYSNSLNLKLENLKEQKPDRVNATVCFCEGRQISTPHKCLALGMTSSGPPAEGSQEDERRVCGAGWGGVGVWHSEWGAGGETESTHRPLLWWVGLKVQELIHHAVSCCSRVPNLSVWKARAESRHIHGDVCERDSLTWYCFSNTNTPQSAMQVQHIEVLRDRKSAEQWKSVLLMEIKDCYVLAAQPVSGPGGW